MSKPIENCPVEEKPIRERAYTDRQLLELAAKAAGIALRPVEVKNVDHKGRDSWVGYMTNPDEWPRGWFNPLTDDGDALRLAVKLELNVVFHRGSHVDVNGESVVHFAGESYAHGEDVSAATRRAIVRAAAAIAEGAKS